MEKWFLYCKKADFAAISKKFNISPMLARILRNRDIISDEDIESFLHVRLSDMHDPFMMKDMEGAVKLVSEAIKDGRKIRIIGDYDVDGVCSSYILKSFISKAGGNVDVRLPDRILEGYGMNESMSDEARENGISLIITCDNGVSSVDAVNRARDFGIDVVITDHHEIPAVLPKANYIIDPKQADCPYPFKDICGAGVAYKFVQALNSYCGLGEDMLIDSLLQFAGMATIADIVPLKGENRIIASEGIRRLRKSDNVGINALIDVKGIVKEELSAFNISFILSPCINSAGRLKNAILAYNLLEEKDPVKASVLAAGLSELNDRRKELTQSQSEIAIKCIEDRIGSGGRIDDIIVIYLPDAHESVAGIIAGRIKDEYNRPAIVVTNSEEGLKGSGRSVDGYNMVEALSSHSELFIKFGGHAKACGFTLKKSGTADEDVKRFRDALNSSSRLQDCDLDKKIWIDMQLPFAYVTEEFVTELQMLEPCGLSNERPVFAEKNVSVGSCSILGKNSNVLKMQLENEKGQRIEGIMFGDEAKIRNYFEQLQNSRKISILFYPTINTYRGYKTPQVNIRSISFI